MTRQKYRYLEADQSAARIEAPTQRPFVGYRADPVVLRLRVPQTVINVIEGDPPPEGEDAPKAPKNQNVVNIYKGASTTVNKTGSGCSPFATAGFPHVMSEPSGYASVYGIQNGGGFWEGYTNAGQVSTGGGLVWGLVFLQDSADRLYIFGLSQWGDRVVAVNTKTCQKFPFDQTVSYADGEKRNLTAELEPGYYLIFGEGDIAV